MSPFRSQRGEGSNASDGAPNELEGDALRSDASSGKLDEPGRAKPCALARVPAFGLGLTPFGSDSLPALSGASSAYIKRKSVGECGGGDGHLTTGGPADGTMRTHGPSAGRPGFACPAKGFKVPGTATGPGPGLSRPARTPSGRNPRATLKAFPFPLSRFVSFGTTGTAETFPGCSRHPMGVHPTRPQQKESHENSRTHQRSAERPPRRGHLHRGQARSIDPENRWQDPALRAGLRPGGRRAERIRTAPRTAGAVQ